MTAHIRWHSDRVKGHNVLCSKARKHRWIGRGFCQSAEHQITIGDHTDKLTLLAADRKASYIFAPHLLGDESDG